MDIRTAFSEEEWKALRAEQPFAFSRHTTIGTGGNALCALYPSSPEMLENALSRLARIGVPRIVLGRGSNVLASDSGFCGVVIKTDRLCMLRRCGQIIEAGSGVRIAKLLAFAAASGCGGLHFLAGIPASVGGAVFMNAGAGGIYIGSRVRSVTALCGKTVRRFTAEECAFSYKHSVFMEKPCCVLSVEFTTDNADKQSILRDINGVISARRRLPRGRSMGCVFKNPQGDPAGALIERAGIKGVSVGGAIVSPAHANFILNTGGASSADVYALIQAVKSAVLRRCGVLLEEEIRYIGEF